LGGLVAEDSGLDPVDVVAEVKVNVGGRAGRSKGAARSQAIAVEGVDDVIAATENVGAMNLKLHLGMGAGVVAVAEAHVDYRLRGRTVGRDPGHRGDVVTHRGRARQAVLDQDRKVIVVNHSDAV